MKKIGALLVILLFITSSFALSGKTTTKETVIAKITYRNEECPISTLQPIVVITQPEDGAVVTDPHLVVLGYAIDEAGMNYWEWEWHWKGGNYTNSSYFETAEYVEFKIDIYGLKEGWNLIIVRFRNIYGAWGEDSVNVTYVPENNPPNKPSPPEGPTEGKVKETLYFNTVTTDPDDDPLEYLIDWGDGTNTGWVGPIASGTPFETFHAWEQPGTYEVKAKARDIPYHQESDWSEPLIVTIYGNDTPVVVIEHPENGTVFTEPNIIVTGYIRDNVGIVHYGYIHEWEEGSTEENWTLEEEPAFYPFEIPLMLHEGWNKIKVYGIDDNENIGEDEKTVWLNVTTKLEIRAVFQPVQVVWQECSDIGNRSYNYMKEIKKGKEYRAMLPMVEKKNTLIFGYPTKTYDKIRVNVTNNLKEKVKFKFRFKIYPDNKVIFTSDVYEIDAGKTEEKVIKCPDGLPPKPDTFQWEKYGDGRIELEAISLQNESISNKVVVHVKIHRTKTLGIAYMSLLIVDENNQPKHGCLAIPKNEAIQHIEQARKFIQGTYPVKDPRGVTSFWAGLRVLKWEEVKETASTVNIAKVLIAASKNHAFGWIEGGAINPPEYPYLGGRIVLLVPRDWPGLFTNEEWAGIMNTGVKHTVIVCKDFWTADAHEIGHTFGLYIEYPYDGEEYRVEHGHVTYEGHQTCGYWVNEREKKEGVICFMGTASFKDLSSRWVCADEYKWLLEKKFSIEDPELLMVLGRIYRNGSTYFDEWYRLPSGMPDIRMNEKGEYTIRFLDIHNEIINETGFNISFEIKDANITLEYAPLSFTVPYPKNTHKIQILHGENVLEERKVSQNSPVVTITYPNGGETLQVGKEYTIRWDASDPDGDDLVFMVGYSCDNGKNWTVIATDIRDTEYTWNCSYVPPGNEYLIGVVASDGVNTGQDISDSTFTILPDTIPPSIKIVQPERGIYINDRKIIPFPFTIIIGKITITAEAEDNVGIINVSFYVDNQLKNASYTPPYSWTWDEFVMGWHEIKVVAYDFSGNTAIDKRKVLIFNI